MANKINKSTVYTQTRMTYLVELCAIKPMSFEELVNKLGIVIETVRLYVRALIEERRIYVCEWVETMGIRQSWYSLFAAGDLPSVARPITDEQARGKAYREKIKAGYVPTPRKTIAKPAPVVAIIGRQTWLSGLGMAA